MEYLTSILTTNQFAQGGLLTVILGGLVGLFYKVINFIFSFVKSVLYTEVQISYIKNPDLYNAISFWLSQNKDKITSNIFELTKLKDIPHNTELSQDILKDYSFTLGSGIHLLKYNKWVYLIYKYKGNGSSTASFAINPKDEDIIIKTIGRKLNVFTDLVDESINIFDKYKNDKIKIYNFDGYSMHNSIRRIDLRPIESVILKNNQEKEILKDIYSFLSKKETLFK